MRVVIDAPIHLLFLLLLLFGLALVVRVGRALAGLDELFALEALVAATALPLLVSSGRLPLLVVLFACRLLGLPEGREGSYEETFEKVA